MAYRKHHKKRTSRTGNRRWTDTHDTWAVPLKLTGIVVVAVVLLLAYGGMVHSRTSLWERIGQAEARSRALQGDLRREQVRWDDMRSAPKLRERLAKNGIRMVRPQSNQRYAMRGPSAPAVPGRPSASGTYAANR